VPRLVAAPPLPSSSVSDGDTASEDDGDIESEDELPQNPNPNLHRRSRSPPGHMPQPEKTDGLMDTTEDDTWTPPPSGGDSLSTSNLFPEEKRESDNTTPSSDSLQTATEPMSIDDGTPMVNP
jgi:hypothetical protein